MHSLAHRRYGNRIGDRVGCLVLSRISPIRGDSNRILGEFDCSCGGSAVLPLGRVLNGGSHTHCGCKTDHGTNRQHGMRCSPEYSSWQAAKRRCLSEGDKDFHRYGAVGVTFWPEWAVSFDAFYAHIGPRPKGTTLDRIDTTKGYQPGNVRWATTIQQARNRRSSFVWFVKGRKFQSAQAAADHFGVSEHTVWRWVRGQFDKRRNKFTPPREDCYANPRY